MSSSTPPAIAESSQATATPKKVINNQQIARLQHRHAWIVNLFTFSGLGLALALLWLDGPVGSIELGLFLGMALITNIGIVVGFHRHFTHRSFQATMPVRVALAILGSMAAQGTLSFWVALHRFHHEHSDTPQDPHSPCFDGERSLNGLRGFWHAYVGWTVKHPVPNPNYYATDLMRDRALVQINKLYLGWVALGLLIPALLGGWWHGSWQGAFYGFLWGGAVRMSLTHNLVWSITSLAHIVGNRPLKSSDRSTNNFWLALPTLGDSWHNNHHAFPNAAIVGWHWWQLDPAGWLIRLLEQFGWVWDVKVPSDRAIAAKTLP